MSASGRNRPVERIAGRTATAAKPPLKTGGVDTGPDVPPEYQARVFDRFFRMPGGNTDGSGLAARLEQEVTAGAMLGELKSRRAGGPAQPGI